jgi:indole-3-glycerol phosphate synthase
VILDDIAKHKRIEVDQRKRSAVVLQPNGTTRDFAASLRRPDGELPHIIAEVKKASPSKGVIRADFDPVAIARRYEEAGASAISVLTEEKFFQGSLAYLTACRDAITIPVLRKDFIIDEYQITEARAAGADAVLLIAALLDTDTLRAFREQAESIGMSALVEVHDENELESALSSDAMIIGINNRNLQTFQVSLETTYRLVKGIPSDKTIVSESGIATNDDLQRLADAGVHAALVGESLMRAGDPGQKLMELMGK